MVDLSDFILSDEQYYIQDILTSPWLTIAANLACCGTGNLSVNVEIEATLAVYSVIELWRISLSVIEGGNSTFFSPQQSIQQSIQQEQQLSQQHELLIRSRVGSTS